MKMKMLRSSILCFVVVFLAAPLLRAQDLSKYRHFSFGMSLTRVLERTEQKMADVKVIHSRPALIQELTWWPPNLPGTSQSDSVQEILFSFYNGALYRISATYDRSAIEGLTEEDVVQSIAAKYGAPKRLATEIPGSEINFPLHDQYDLKERVVASWEDTQCSFNLVRSSYSDGYGLVMLSRQMNAEAELAIVGAVKLEKDEIPQSEAARQKKETDDLEAARQKNRKIFHP
ncbi:MAG: hypothetical protein ACHQLQ_11665 [Candidatus Acidiferrales bacterium]